MPGACRVPPLCASGLPVKNTKRWREIVAGVAILGLVAYWADQGSLLFGLTRANLIPTIWRSVNLLDGVSPLLPELLLLIGVYLWFWCGLRGLAHFGDDRPQLPRLADLPRSEDNHSRLPMFSWEVAGLSVEHAALPLTGWYAVRLLAIFANYHYCFRDRPARNLDPHSGRARVWFPDLLLDLPGRFRDSHRWHPNVASMDRTQATAGLSGSATVASNAPLTQGAHLGIDLEDEWQRARRALP